MSDKEKIEFFWRSIQRYDHYIESTNTKSTIIFSLCTFILGGIVASDVFADLVQGSTSFGAKLLTTIGITLVVSTLLVLARSFKVIYPKTPPDEERSLIFFEDVSQMSRERLLQRVEKLDTKKALRDLVGQNWILSKIATEKFKHLKHAFFGLKFSIILVGLLCIFVILN
jgi:hypothetical protein